ncbi:hypothetical protein FJZ53_02875 [Candidatus Woesearchaeota archaeon]|nr:hypothetical protein [Candidatus Woesearchaeota archaeon]
MKDKQNLTGNLGALVKNFSNLHSIEPDSMLDLNTTTFLQKLVSKDVIDAGVRVKPKDYLKSLVLLEYFSGIIEGDYMACKNLAKISEKIRKIEDEEDTSVDPHERDSYLTLPVVIAEAALCANEKEDTYSDNASLKKIKVRYQNHDMKIDLHSPKSKKPEPYYDMIGQMVLDVTSKSVEHYLEKVSSRAELSSLIFTGHALDMIKSDSQKSKVKTALEKKDYFSASLEALKGIMKDITISVIDEYISNLEG